MSSNKFIANPLSKAVLGGMTYLDRYLEVPNHSVPNLLSLSINNECNLSCPHCIERDYSRGKDKYGLLKERLGGLADDSVLWTSIAGKEPTVTPQRLEEIAKVAKRKSSKVILMSNGVFLDESLQERLRGSVDYLDISFDGVDEDSYKNPSSGVWDNILSASRNGFEKVTALSILGRNNYRKAGDLVDKVADESRGEVAHSIGFYLGCPGDSGLLKEDEMVSAIENILEKEKPTVVQIGLAYSRFLSRIFREFGVNQKTLRYDSRTGIPTYEIGKNSLLIPASHLETPMNFLRAEIDGKVYFGCSHLMLRGDTSDFAVGDLEKESLKDIFDRVISKESEFIRKTEGVYEVCLNSKCFGSCRGGDRLNGVIFKGESSDPYCEKLN